MSAVSAAALDVVSAVPADGEAAVRAAFDLSRSAIGGARRSGCIGWVTARSSVRRVSREVLAISV
jgi:hypothetical protein